MADASKNLPSERQIEQLRNWKGGLVPWSCAHRCAEVKIAKFSLINHNKNAARLQLTGRTALENSAVELVEIELK
jgi:hypothetical protein